MFSLRKNFSWRTKTVHGPHLASWLFFRASSTFWINFLLFFFIMSSSFLLLFLFFFLFSPLLNPRNSRIHTSECIWLFCAHACNMKCVLRTHVRWRYFPLISWAYAIFFFLIWKSKTMQIYWVNSESFSVYFRANETVQALAMSS